MNDQPDSSLETGLIATVQRRLFRRISIGPDDRLHTASERLAYLNLTQREEETLLEIRQLHEEAFDVEKVTKKFLEEYRSLFRTLQLDLQTQSGDNVWAHDYALQFLNRCMFIYFIQRKGWLGEDKEFLRSFWDSYRKPTLQLKDLPEYATDAFYAYWLKVLFFEAFNNHYQNRHPYFPTHINAILANAPYLNGGLFSVNDLDREFDQRPCVITNERFAQVLGLFERYNFTIAEDSPLDQQVAVDPEMIGRVYESLVNVSTELDERGDVGIFYTPRTEIDLMCRLALVDYLANHSEVQHKGALYDAVFALEPHEKSEPTSSSTWTPGKRDNGASKRNSCNPSSKARANVRAS